MTGRVLPRRRGDQMLLWMVVAAAVVVLVNAVAAVVTGRVLLLAFAAGPTVALLTVGFTLSRHLNRKDGEARSLGGSC